MNKKMYATPAIAGLLALPMAGYATYYMMKDSPFAFEPDKKIGETAEKQGQTVDKKVESPSASAPKSRPTSRPRSCRPRKRPTTRASSAATSAPTC